VGKLSNPRLLIVGASGFLGQHIGRKAASAFDVYEADIATPPGKRGLAMDITSAASVNAGFEWAAPDAAILLAAISDIDECERRPELAQAVNVRGAEHVAEACARSRARLVFTSSAAVFNGTRHGYNESDPPTPMSVYGTTKALAEDTISRKLPSALILRLALAIGFAEGSGTNAMLNKFAARLRAGESVSLPDYEYRNPIDAETLSCFLLELLNCGGAAGIFHVGATESISRFELGVRLAEKMGLSPRLVHPQTQPLPGRAPRGPDHFLLTGRLRATCRTPVPSCSEIIERAIHGSPQSNS
jgi:dTDP-4-dehydrorhamnose reductase